MWLTEEPSWFEFQRRSCVLLKKKLGPNNSHAEEVYFEVAFAPPQFACIPVCVHSHLWKTSGYLKVCSYYKYWTLFQSRFRYWMCNVWSSGKLCLALGKKQLRCSGACGTFPDEGWNLSLLHCQAHSLPLRHQGSPWVLFCFCFLSLLVLIAV